MKKWVKLKGVKLIRRAVAIKVIDTISKYITTPTILEKRARFSHYPSEASIVSRIDGKLVGKCHRASWFDWMGIEPTNKIDMRGRWTFKMGNVIEAAYTEYIKQAGIWAGNNIKFYNREHNVSGEADIFIFPAPNSEKIDGVEIKTAYGYGFQKSVMQFPKIENLMQCGIYLDYFSQELGTYGDGKQVLDTWHLIYKARDTQEEVEYIITMAEEEKGKYLQVDGIPVRLFYLEDVYNRYKTLGNYVIKNEMPPQEYTCGYSLEQSEQRFKNSEISKTAMAQIRAGKKIDSDWRCLYCNHLNRCWKEKRVPQRSISITK